MGDHDRKEVGSVAESLKENLHLMTTDFNSSISFCVGFLEIPNANANTK